MSQKHEGDHPTGGGWRLQPLPCKIVELIEIRSPRRIVIVNDEDYLLERIEGYICVLFKDVPLTIQTFRSCREAWQELMRNAPDILITDDIMDKNDEFNGEELVRRLIRINVTYPIIVTSDWLPTEVWVKECMKRNSKISFLKVPVPFTEEVLKEALSKHLGAGIKLRFPADAPPILETQVPTNAGSSKQSESTPPSRMSPWKSGDMNADPLFDQNKADAEKGNANAQAYLGYCYHNGQGVAKDYVEAVKWYRKAAEQGNAAAQCNLGICYEHGNGVRKDKAEAVKWYRKAAEQGNAYAQYNLGICYSDGDVVAKHPDPVDVIVSWGLSTLGMGSVGKDAAEAVKWFRKAAEQGHSDAQNKLGCCYEEGSGVKKDLAEAAKWYRKAAEQGNAPAQYNLGVCYKSGTGVPKNFVEAHKWHNLASAQGFGTAKTQRFWSEVFMTREQIAEAQRRASEFRPRKAPEAGASVSGRDVVDSNPAASGTGFFITEDGFLVTNEHVVRDASQICLVTSIGSVPARVVKVDKPNDLALLKAEGRFAPLPIASSRAVKLGGTVVTVGFPNIGLQGFAPKLARGEIASMSGVQDDARYFQISLPVQPGNSGGALVDERGNVVGVVSAKLNAGAALATSGALPENVNYAVKSSFLLSFLESVPDVANKLKAPVTADRKFEDVVKSAQDAAVLVLVY